MAANDLLDYQAIFRSTPTALLVVSRDHTIASANHCFAEILGQRPETFVGRPLLDVLPVGDATNQLRGALDRVFATGESESLPLLRVRLPDGEGGLRDRHWSCTSVAVRAPDGSVAFVAQHTQDVTEMHGRLHADAVGAGQGALSHEEEFGSSLFHRAERVQARNALLVAETGELRNLFMRAPSFMCLLRGADYRVELANSAFLELVGRRELIGRSFREAVPEVEGQLYVDLLDKVYRSGEAFVGKQMRAEFERVAGRRPEEVFISFVFQPILGPDGRAIGIFIDGNDVTDHVRAEKAQALLVRELHHRVRNTLATVQGVMNSTARPAESIADYQWAFSGRILTCRWTETGGPPVSPPTRQGFGSMMLTRVLTQQIGAKVDASYSSGGFELRADIPLVIERA